MNAHTGQPISGIDHLRQSIADILTTPLGSRIERREYGSLLPFLIDSPMNAAGRMRVIAAAAMPLLRDEPRLKLSRITTIATPDAPASLTLEISGNYVDGTGRQQPITTAVEIGRPQ
ncbi:GPW/gp25 family protein [Chitinimonas prasina]|nr:GPW/gp25 family protein [Chitinimonas prasina]